MSDIDLSGFTGTEVWHRHPLARTVLYTDGVEYLADKAGAYWLIDLIASCQLIPEIHTQPFQTWKLRVENHKGEVVCEDGDYNELHRQKINFTDFPLPEIELWVEFSGQFRVILLPSEH